MIYLKITLFNSKKISGYLTIFEVPNVRQSYTKAIFLLAVTSINYILFLPDFPGSIGVGQTDTAFNRRFLNIFFYY